MASYTELFAGSDTVTTATEESCANNTTLTTAQTVTTDGHVQLVLDLNDMVDGDKLRVRFYEKVQSSGARRVFWAPIISDGPGEEKIMYFPVFQLMHGWDITLEQIAGTANIVIDWSIRSVTP